MGRISLYRSEKTNDYKFLDRIVREQFTAGGTDLYIHKYLGTPDTGPSKDLTQPQHNQLDPKNIQDLLFLENRDRVYDKDIYRLRGHYNVQNLDFDLSQFGLFLNNDIIFITVHYNDMIGILGRKIMVGDVFELPHLTDYHPLNETIPVGLRRYYQVTDGNFASEGFSQTWYPHLWRIKCEPLVDSQEFSNILKAPVQQENYLGDWDKTATYPQGYVLSFGGQNYITKHDTPVGIPPIGDTQSYHYWQLDTADSLKDILSRYNQNIAVSNAVIDEAARRVPKTGYDRSQLYLVSTKSGKTPQPAVNIVRAPGAPLATRGTVLLYSSPGYSQNTPVIQVPVAALKQLWEATGKTGIELTKFIQTSLEIAEKAPDRLDSGAGQVKGEMVLAVKAVAPITAPYGTADNTYSNASQDPSDPSFDPTLIVDSNIMDFRADADPRFAFVARYTPEGYGYTGGYLTGDGTAPNGIPTGSGTSFPSDPTLGDYFLRIDYVPNLLYRYDGNLWVRIGQNDRASAGTDSSETVLGSFVNNTNTMTLTDGSTIPEQQALSSLLKIQID
jgi:hypothetical protein